jgi:phosphoglucosamine mutase
MRVYPQVLPNVRVADKRRFEDDPRVKAAIESAGNALKGTGRILVRPSGTEPLIRIMVEGPDRAQVERLAKSVAEQVAASESA